MEFEWEPNSELAATREGDTVSVRGNGAGLRSLAQHLLRLGADGVPVGQHLHLDDLTGLDGSIELILERDAE
jgi:hypothetical protein